MNDFFFSILQWINSWVGNYGWSMVIFTLLIRLVLTPLDYRSRVGLRRTSQIQPKIQALQKKYANDKEKLNQKTAELYRKEHVNPLSSCLPLLLTWPILIAVFAAMRLAANWEMLEQISQIVTNSPVVMEPWLWVKNVWMPDMPFSPSMPDLGMMQQIPADMWLNWFNGYQGNLPPMIANLGLTADSFSGANLSKTLAMIQAAMKANNPEYAAAIATKPGWTNINLLITSFSVMDHPNGFLILPLLSAGTQILMTKVTSPSKKDQEAQPQQTNSASKFMTWFFPIFSLIICFNSSATFALYWVAGNVISTIQTLIINKMLDSKDKRREAAQAAEGGKIK